MVNRAEESLSEDNTTFLVRRLSIRLETDCIVPSLHIASALADLTGKPNNFSQWLDDHELLRKINKLDVVKSQPDTAFEYYDDDADDDPYHYDEETERVVGGIKDVLWKFIAEVVRDTGTDLDKIISGL